MKTNYKCCAVFVLFLVLGFTTQVSAQSVGDVMWEDHFDDPENDYLLNDVGWVYYGEEDDLVGQVVMQTEDEKAYLKAGVFSSIVGAAVIETNGVAYVDPEDIEDTEDRMREQSEFNDPNQLISFNVNFKKMSVVEDGQYPMGTFFACGARIQTRGDDAYPDPTVDSTYVLFIAPLANITGIAKVAGELQILDPSSWTWLTEQSMDFEYDLGVPYNVKYYLNGSDLKVKVWEGDATDEPDEWLLETVDPEPRVNGTFVEFAILGDPVTSGTEPDGDEILLDDVVVYFLPESGVETDSPAMPAAFDLADNYPNPFNPQTTIEYSLQQSGDVSLRVFSVSGQRVQTLVQEHQPAGKHSIVFNAVDDSGETLPSGLYFYTLTHGPQIVTKKMILAK